jgi:CBS domain-containing protein
MMVENHVSMIPIVEGGRPIGVVTRRVMIATALRHLLGDAEVDG